MSSPTRPDQPLRILIVEDEALLALQMEGALADGGHEVVGLADTPDEAVALADRARPQLALVDIQLHGRRVGVELALELGRHGVPCLFATGNCPEEGGRDAALGCLHKPFADRTLREAVEVARSLLGGHEPAFVPLGLHLY
ncbi:response regulator [Rubellimicrobium aerolatum]|uniref:Response regulator n=1 Tax=Rubellimicrobium aerolatum TaxID=490979 RepID=A0ABW0SDP4_9RHOB